MQSRHLLTSCSLILLCCASAAVGAQPAAAGTQAFNRAVTAFQTGNFQEALADFLEARREGIDSSQLTYDLGVTYYRLARYSEARHEFSALVDIPSLAALAHYNLGLVALRQQIAQAHARSSIKPI